MLAALVVLFATDRLLMSSPELWTRVHHRLSLEDAMNFWISLTEMRRTRFAGEHDDRTRVIALGSSRAAASFLSENISDDDKEWVHATNLGRPGVDPFVLRSMVDGVVALEPDVVVLYLSEFDTHRAIFMIPEATDADLPSLIELLRYTGPVHGWNERRKLLQILAGGVMQTYHHRNMLLAAGLGRVGEFEMAERGLDTTTPLPPAHRFGFHRTPDRQAKWFVELVAEVEAKHGSELEVAQFTQLHEVVRGEQVRVQEALIETAIERFRRSGVEVLIFESPLNPLGAPLWDADLREDFLAFARRMVRTHGAWFLPLEQSGPFGHEDFADLTHLDFEGGLLATRQVLERIRREMVGDRSS
jgi:hypothetical protein